MISTFRSLVYVSVVVAAFPVIACAIDTVELTTGAKATGTIKSYSGDVVIVEVKIGTRTIQRRY